MKRAFVDGILIDWGASLFNQSPVRRVKSPKSVLTGQVPQARPKTGGVIAAKGGAVQVREKLSALVRRAPEVMVKISGGGKGMAQIKAHMDYISRNGKIEMENQDGELILGRDEVDLVRSEWQNSGYRLKDQTETREAFNIVLSMPEGTDPAGLRSAARDFAALEFDGHEYVMALHTYETDPDPKPARHPHVHLAVKARNDVGVRLNPRKGDLQRWREGFAHVLREHGIDAVATPRQVRLKRVRGEKKSVKEMRARGEVLDQVGKGRVSDAHLAQARATELRVLQSYRHITQALAQSEDEEDQKLAVGLVDRLRWERGLGQVEIEQAPTKPRDRDRDR